MTNFFSIFITSMSDNTCSLAFCPFWLRAPVCLLQINRFNFLISNHKSFSFFVIIYGKKKRVKKNCIHTVQNSVDLFSFDGNEVDKKMTEWMKTSSKYVLIGGTNRPTKKKNIKKIYLNRLNANGIFAKTVIRLCTTSSCHWHSRMPDLARVSLLFSFRFCFSVLRYKSLPSYMLQIQCLYLDSYQRICTPISTKSIFTHFLSFFRLFIDCIFLFFILLNACFVHSDVICICHSLKW